MAREFEFQDKQWSAEGVGASHGGATGGMRHQVRFTRVSDGHKETSWISTADVDAVPLRELQMALAAARDPLVRAERALKDEFDAVATVGTPTRNGTLGSVWVKYSPANASQEFSFPLDGDIEREIDALRVSIRRWIVNTGRSV